MPRILSLAPLAAVLLAVPAVAQQQLWGLNDVFHLGDPKPEPAATASVGPRIYQPTRPFVIGRDNLGFANLGGAISLGGMSGNCYTMAAVSKLFYQAAEFRASELVSPTFLAADVADSLRSESFPSPSFPVRAFGDLYSLSTPPEGVDAEDWMERNARAEAGLAPPPSGGPDPLNRSALTQLYQMISTIHYMHYVQFQAGNLIGGAVRQATQGGAAVPEVMASTLTRIKQDLSADRLSMVCIFNPRPEVFYGHVVLAYKLIETPGGYTDVYVYDSNAQYVRSRRLDDDRDQSILRVHADGRLELLVERFGTGVVEAFGMYDGDSWFNDPAATILMVMDDLEDDADLRRRLALKLEAARESAGYLLATGDLLSALTTVSPEDSPLSQDVLAFLRSVQQVEGKAPLSEEATITDMNRFLAAHADSALRTIFPQALPEGLELSETSLVFDESDPNRARLGTTLTVSRSADLDTVLRAVQGSALLGNQQTGELIGAVAAAFEGQVVRLTTEVDLVKGPTGGRLGAFGPVPTLRRSHLVVGDIEAPPADPTKGAHRIEISEAVIRRFIRTLLTQRNVIDHRLVYDYEIPVLGDREARFEVDDVEVVCAGPSVFSRRGKLGVRFRYHGFAAVVTQSRGVNLSSDDTTLWVKLRPGSEENSLQVRGRISGEHDISTGLGIFGGPVERAVTSALTAVLRDVDDQLDALIDEALEPYVELVGPGPRVRDIEVSDEDLSAQVETFTVAIELTLARVLGFPVGAVPLSLREVDFTDDRVFLVLDNR